MLEPIEGSSDRDSVVRQIKFVGREPERLVVSPQQTAHEFNGRQKMRVDESDARAGKLPVFNEMQKLFLVYRGCLRNSVQKRQYFSPVLEPSQRQLGDRKGMHGDDGLVQQSFQMGIFLTKVIDPDGGIDQDNHILSTATRNVPQSFFAAAQTG